MVVKQQLEVPKQQEFELERGEMLRRHQLGVVGRWARLEIVVLMMKEELLLVLKVAVQGRLGEKTDEDWFEQAEEDANLIEEVEWIDSHLLQEH